MILADTEFLQMESDEKEEEEEEECRGKKSDADSVDLHDDMHRKWNDDGKTGHPLIQRSKYWRRRRRRRRSSSSSMCCC